MRIAQALIRQWPEQRDRLRPLQDLSPALVLAFGDLRLLDTPGLARDLAAAFPGAVLAGCSTAGEIHDGQVLEGSLSVTALDLGSLACFPASTELAGSEDSFSAGERLGAALAAGGARAALVFAQGVRINGSALVDGLASRFPEGIPIGGGLAGDGGAFQGTVVLSAEGLSATRILALGFHGERLAFSSGSFGGWKAFGPLRKVTAARGNVLLELDGEPALATYKRYLGDHARELPGSGLRFPFEMVSRGLASEGVIRTILGVDEGEGSLTLAGEVDPEGFLRLMHAQTDGLVDGADEAARLALGGDARLAGPTLALLVSCVGRKLVMGGRVEEEVEAVAARCGAFAHLTGFYSYGEIGPVPGGSCRLHNQTMTLSLIAERDG